MTKGSNRKRIIRLKISDVAKKDIRSIQKYTTKNWGDEKQKEYLGKIKKQIQTLAFNPRIGVFRKDLGGQHRSIAVGRHFIIYKHADKHIQIVRILHVNMDLKRELVRTREKERGLER